MEFQKYCTEKSQLKIFFVSVLNEKMKSYSIAPCIPPGREDGRGTKEEGRGSRNRQLAPRRHQGGTEEAQAIYINSNATTSKIGT